MEISPTGSTFRMKTRFARFQNGQELLRMWSVFADVKTADDLDLPVPSLEQRDDGSRAPSTVPVQPTVELEHYVASLAERAGKVATRQVRPDEDNILLIATDGRKAALDIRMVIPRDPSGPSKVDVAADAIHRIWERTRDNEYLDTLTGQPSTVRGSLQLVFSDIGTRTRTGGTPTTSCGSSSCSAASPPSRSGTCTRRRPTSRRPACSPQPAPATSRY